MEIYPRFNEIDDALKLKQEGYMDLNLDILSREKEVVVVALSHYYKHHSGDMVPDPDMELAIYPELKELEALTFQNLFIYQSVYENYPNKESVNPAYKKDQNDFLLLWLSNLKAQGFRQ